jgi:hypothetical protein
VAASGKVLLALLAVHVAGFAADVGFVHFDFPVELAAVVVRMASRIR